MTHDCRRLLGAALIATACQQALCKSSDDSLLFEARWGHVAGNGFDDPGGLDRRVSDFQTGDRWRLRAEWRPSPWWYLTGEYLQGRVEYSSPLNPRCGLDPDRFLGLLGCQIAAPPPRAGRIEDDLEGFNAGIGLRWPIADQWVGDVEVGYGLLEWSSDDDVEAIALATCRRFNVVPLPGCTTVRTEARRHGWTGSLGLAYDVSDTLTVSSRLHLQEFRYRLYRNDVVPRFGDANCPTPTSCNIDPASVIATQSDGSWSWISARASVHLSEHWTGFLEIEAGGSRGWTGTDVGVRWSW